MFKVFTDTDTDIDLKLAEYYGFELISMPYCIEDKMVFPYKDFEEFDYKSFYDLLRKGTIPKTCAINPSEYIGYFEPFLKEGYDILYIHFSRAMSGTFDFMDTAIRDLKEKYPERTVYEIDTKGITLCSYIIVRELGDMYLKGATIEEMMNWAKSEVDHYACYFFAEDLKFFKASGRVKNYQAFFGNLVGIKPIIFMNSEGKMVNIGKERGKANAINRLVEIVKELGDDVCNHRIVIAHSDCLETAKMIGSKLKSEFNDKLDIDYVVVNPTAGSHCGPSGTGISFHAKGRELF